jgi:hypothetical protein
VSELYDVRWCGADTDHACHFWTFDGTALLLCAGGQRDNHRLVHSWKNPDVLG